MPVLVAPDRPLQDDVVSLRAWRPEDREVVVAAVQDPEIPRWTQVASPYGPAEFDGWLTEQARQLSAGTGLHFLVADAEDRILGASGVQLTEDAPDIGYWCMREHRGRGTRRAPSGCSPGPCSRSDSRGVDVFAHEHNAASQRVAVAAGFRRVPGRRRWAASAAARSTSASRVRSRDRRRRPPAGRPPADDLRG